jgi:hypothetical protein
MQNFLGKISHQFVGLKDQLDALSVTRLDDVKHLTKRMRDLEEETTQP